MSRVHYFLGPNFWLLSVKVKMRISENGRERFGQTRLSG